MYGMPYFAIQCCCMNLNIGQNFVDKSVKGSINTLFLIYYASCQQGRSTKPKKESSIPNYRESALL